MEISELGGICEGFSTYPGLKNTSGRIDDTAVGGWEVLCSPQAPYRPMDLANAEIMEAESLIPMIGYHHAYGICIVAMRRHKRRRVLFRGSLPLASYGSGEPALAIDRAPGRVRPLRACNWDCLLSCEARKYLISFGRPPS
jgi:hypothetical protein